MKRIFRQKGSRAYRLRYRVGDDPRLYDVPLKTTIKEVAEAKARQIVEERERELVGLLDPKPLRDAAKRAIDEHLADYVADLTARGNGKDHIVHARQRLKRLVAECSWKLLRDVTNDSFTKWLGRQTKLSHKTRNEYLGHLKAFMNWLVSQDRLTQSPVAKLKRLDTRGKETFKRRALSLDEYQRLMANAGERRLAYSLACLTGLRRGELKKLLWADVRLDGPAPSIEVRAATTKNKLSEVIPVIPFLCEQLKACQGAATGLVLPGGVPSAKTLGKDLTAAGIAVTDERGWRLDFHALRHSLSSLLMEAGVPEGVRMRLMRHRTLKQTSHYTDPKSVPLFQGMAQLAQYLPSSIASLNSGKPSPNNGDVVQSDISHESVETVDFRGEMPLLSKAVPSWENLEMVPPRGIEPRFED